MKTRNEMSREEATRDPIFLLQVRGDKRAKWRTETVFFSRGEGEAWAKAHEYRWGEWQVYCVHATGDLCDVLRMPEAVASCQAMEAELAKGGA
jgi:hypothetical protein